MDARWLPDLLLALTNIKRNDLRQKNDEFNTVPAERDTTGP